MYLLDTNIPLEILLGQDKSEEVEKFMNSIDEDLIYISEFSLYSIGIKLNLKNKDDKFSNFIDDLFISGNVNLVSLSPADLKILVENSRLYNLDFDDAYQFTCANKYNLTLVSFDSDFDKSPIIRKEPKQLLS